MPLKPVSRGVIYTINLTSKFARSDKYRQRERERERERDRKTERQKDRKTERQRRYKQKQIGCTGKHIYLCMYVPVCSLAHNQLLVKASSVTLGESVFEILLQSS